MAIRADNPGGASPLTIHISGRFDYTCHREFREAYAEARLDARTPVVIDLREVEYMDSAALGMLLVLREKSGGNNAQITLRGAGPQLRELLDISRFDQMFEVQ